MRTPIRIALAIQLLALPFCLVPPLASAGTEAEGQGARANSLEACSWSMQFGITDEIGLKPFGGMSISLKRHTSPRSAYRLGVNLGLDFDDTESDLVDVRADTVNYDSGDNRNANAQLVQVDLLYMRYPNPEANLTLFVGAGPLFRYSRSETERDRSYTSQGSAIREISDQWSRSWKVGVLGAGGVEWFATKVISFHAEYRASLSYGGSKTKSEVRRPTDPTYYRKSGGSGTSWDFHGVAVTFGVSLYF
jgi:opacity protein-like surface antigen